MSADTQTAPGAESLDDVFRAALEQEAQANPDGPVSDQAVSAPPRIVSSSERDAPHGRDTDGTPLAPYGINKKTGRPNLKAAGPGRPSKNPDRPRTTTKPSAESKGGKGGAPPEAVDYRADLAGLGQSVWVAGVMLPPARPYATVFKSGLPGMVDAWNQAANQNATVRGYVEKLAGEGSYAWVLAVAVTTVPVVITCLKLAGKEKDPAKQAQKDQVRLTLAAQAEAELEEYMSRMMQAAAEQEAA